MLANSGGIAFGRRCYTPDASKLSRYENESWQRPLRRLQIPLVSINSPSAPTTTLRIFDLAQDESMHIDLHCLEQY